jgi:predicted Zn-dependent protease with MMP-like domain
MIDVAGPPTRRLTVAGPAPTCLRRTTLKGVSDPFDTYVEEALAVLPAELRKQMSNVEIVVEDEPPPGERLLGLYQGVPLTRRTSNYSGALPDKITIFSGPLERNFGHDPELLRRQAIHVVLHEIAHHFGISDERRVELGRY